MITSMVDLPKGSELPFISNALIKRCNKKWKKEKHIVFYPKYHDFANNYVSKDSVNHIVTVVEKDELEDITKKCKQAQVSINDYLMAEIYIGDATGKIIIASDIRERLHCYQPGALGNYSTAFGITCKSSDKDPIKLAKSIHKKVKKVLSHEKAAMQVLSCYIAMDPGLLDSAAISTFGGFESKVGSFVGGYMFGFRNQSGYSITNLGKIESQYIRSAIFIPPASPAIKKIIGILTVNGIMYKCTSER